MKDFKKPLFAITLRLGALVAFVAWPLLRPRPELKFLTTRGGQIRKDAEDLYGVLKKRFRVLRLPLNYHYVFEIDNLFLTCQLYSIVIPTVGQPLILLLCTELHR